MCCCADFCQEYLFATWEIVRSEYEGGGGRRTEGGERRKKNGNQGRRGRKQEREEGRRRRTTNEEEKDEQEVKRMEGKGTGKKDDPMPSREPTQARTISIR